MAAAGEVLRRNLPERVEVSDGSPSGSRELHVLAVDDSHVDRKVIERLLKISSCKGGVFFYDLVVVYVAFFVYWFVKLIGLG